MNHTSDTPTLPPSQKNTRPKSIVSLLKKPKVSAESDTGEKHYYRNYNEKYLSFGFITHNTGDFDRPQCVLCGDLFSNESFKEDKLKGHLESKHANFKDKDLAFFQFHKDEFEGRKKKLFKSKPNLDKYLSVSYEISLLIAKKMKNYTIGEELILPSIKIMVKELFGEIFLHLVDKICLSNDTVKRRIDNIHDDIKDQLKTRLKQSLFQFFCLQIDETTDIKNNFVMAVFIRWAENGEICEEILGHEILEGSITGKNIFNKLKEIFTDYDLSFDHLIGLTTDGAANMVGAKKGLHAFVREKSPNCLMLHCMIHRNALATNIMPVEFSAQITKIVEIINKIKKSSLNSRLFKELCDDENEKYNQLLYFTPIRWLSKGKMVLRFHILLGKIRKFMDQIGDYELFEILRDDKFIESVAYFADIFTKLNNVNLEL